MSLVMKANTLIDNSSTEEAITSLDLWENLSEVDNLGYTVIPVSYTHLTLPTKLEV